MSPWRQWVPKMCSKELPQRQSMMPTLILDTHWRYWQREKPLTREDSLSQRHRTTSCKVTVSGPTSQGAALQLEQHFSVIEWNGLLSRGSCPKHPSRVNLTSSGAIWASKSIIAYYTAHQLQVWVHNVRFYQKVCHHHNNVGSVPQHQTVCPITNEFLAMGLVNWHCCTVASEVMG